jgi:hypothetical protein
LGRVAETIGQAELERQAGGRDRTGDTKREGPFGAQGKQPPPLQAFFAES